jgi:hypothetical protein
MRAVLVAMLFAFSFAAAASAQTAFVNSPNPSSRVRWHAVTGAVHHVVLSPRLHRHAVSGAVHHVVLSPRLHRHADADARPAQWCGWFMRQVFGVADRAYNVARNWARWGHRAAGPQIGAVVVWWHHVGLIEGGPDAHGRWLVRSGNDGHAVRTRYLSLAGAIAFRTP